MLKMKPSALSILETTEKRASERSFAFEWLALLVRSAKSVCSLQESTTIEWRDPVHAVGECCTAEVGLFHSD